jgi:hypothetical protein
MFCTSILCGINFSARVLDSFSCRQVVSKQFKYAQCQQTGWLMLNMCIAVSSAFSLIDIGSVGKAMFLSFGASNKFASVASK